MKLFICECGKEYSNSQGFNGHRAHCKVHLARLGENHIHQRANLDKSAQEALNKYNKNKHLLKEQREVEKLQKWINEKHTCERCGKIMTEKCGSGRFCSASCANSRPKSLEERAKIGKGVVTSEKFIAKIDMRKQERILNEKVYLENPNYCPICNSVLSYNIKDNKTCGAKVCINEFLRRKQLEKVENGTHKGWIRRNELSYPEQFWKKVLDNNGISYEHDYPISTGVTHYLLDFFIDNTIDLEIDGGQHELPEAVKHDKKRDMYVSSIGYYVYRIKWINPAHNESAVQSQIHDFLEWYDKIKIEHEV